MREAFGAAFAVEPGYVNTASVGVPPQDAVEAVRGHVEAWSCGRLAPPEFDVPVARARAGFAELVGAPTSRVAIGATVSGILGLVASSLPRSRVLTARREFTSVSFPFAACGHEVTEVDLGDLVDRGADHDVVAVSVVASADGAVADLAGLRRLREQGTLVVLDATQSLGWLPADLSWADAVVAGSYKWLLAPRGAAWGAFSPTLLDRLVPASANWYGGADIWTSIYGLPLRLADDARRLDLSPAWFAHVGAAVSLPWLAALDRGAVHAHAVGLADRVRAALDLPPSPSAILSVRRDGAAERLARAGVQAAVRDGAVRVGFHLYNTDADVDRVLAALGG